MTKTISSPPLSYRRNGQGILGLIFALGAACVAITGCKEPEQPIRIAKNPWPGYEFLHLAQDKGFFAEEGVTVKIIEMTSLWDSRRAFERGQADAMTCTLIELLQTREHPSRSPQVAYVTDYSDGADMLLASHVIKSLPDLRGKRIAVEPASLNVYILSKALARAGLTLTDVTLVPTDLSGMVQTFNAGTVDAVVTYPPASVALLKSGSVHPLFSSKDIPEEVVDVIVFDEKTMTDRTKDVTKILRAFARAADYAKTHQDESYRLMAAREGITPEEFRSALEGGIHLASLAEQASFFQRGGPLERAIENTDAVLRGIGELKGPDRTAGCLNYLPVTQAVSK